MNIQNLKPASELAQRFGVKALVYGVPITAAENRTLKTAGAEYTVKDKGLGITFFTRIVE